MSDLDVFGAVRAEAKLYALAILEAQLNRDGWPCVIREKHGSEWIEFKECAGSVSVVALPSGVRVESNAPPGVNEAIGRAMPTIREHVSRTVQP